MDRVTVLDLPSPIAPSVYQRTIAKLTFRNVSYILLLASAIACVAYMVYSWKTSKKMVEKLSTDETVMPVAVEVPTNSEISIEPLRVSIVEQQEKTAVSKWSISKCVTKENIILGAAGALCTIGYVFFGRKSSIPSSPFGSPNPAQRYVAPVNAQVTSLASQLAFGEQFRLLVESEQKVRGLFDGLQVIGRSQLEQVRLDESEQKARGQIDGLQVIGRSQLEQVRLG